MKQTKIHKPISSVLSLGAIAFLLITVLTPGSSIGFTSKADNFAATGDTADCRLLSHASISYSGSANPGIIFNPADISGEGAGFMTSTNSDFGTLSTNHAAALLSAASPNGNSRNSTASSVSVAPGMNVDLNASLYNDKWVNPQTASIENIKFMVTDGSVKNIMSPADQVSVSNNPINIIDNGNNYTINKSHIDKTTIQSIGADSYYKTTIKTFKVIQPVEVVSRSLTSSIVAGNLQATIKTTIKNNSIETLAAGSVEIRTPYPTSSGNPDSVITTGLNPSETKEITQVLNLGNAANIIGVTTIPAGSVSMVNPFKVVISPAYTGSGRPNAIDKANINIDRVTNSLGLRTQFGSHNPVEMSISVIPYSMPLQPLAIIAPIHDVSLTKTSTNIGTITSGDDLSYKMTISNNGETNINAFTIEDVMSSGSGADMATATFVVDPTKAVQDGVTIINGNKATAKFNLLAPLKPGESIDVAMTVKTLIDEKCEVTSKEVKNTARVTLHQNLAQENNQVATYDIALGCQANDNNCSSTIVSVVSKKKCTLVRTGGQSSYTFMITLIVMLPLLSGIIFTFKKRA